MPTNKDFTLSILVGDTVLPEYEKDGIVYVESNFFTPYSFKQQAEDNIDGEVEIQSWPVTPFSIQIESKVGSTACYYRFYIDGQKVTSKSLPPGTKRTVKGFRDGTLVREFLFSLPRYAKNETDRIDAGLSSKVGVIEVECCLATLRTTQTRYRNKELQYDQANKKDCQKVTSGNYLMSTTKAGRVVGVKNSLRNIDYWDIQSVSSRMSVKYVTVQTLQDLNIQVIPIPFPPNVKDRKLCTLRSRPNILKKKPKIKTEVTDVTGSSSSHVTGSSSSHVIGNDDNKDKENHVTCSENEKMEDHEYSGGPVFVKEEIVGATFEDGETIDLTLDDGCEDDDIIDVDADEDEDKILDDNEVDDENDDVINEEDIIALDIKT